MRNSVFPDCRPWALCILALLLVLVVIGAILFGALSISPVDLLFGSLSQTQQAVLFSIRVPRVLLATVVGAALSVSGAAMQGLFRNPLADPGLIGIAGGAALAVAIMLVVIGPHGGLIGLYGLSAAAFVGGVTTTVIIFGFSRLTGQFSVTHMLLAGIAINALTGAGVGFLSFISDDTQLRALTFWTMGSVGGALWPSVFVVLSVIVPTLVALMRTARSLNIMLLGEEEALHLGVDSNRVKRVVIVCTALSVGAAVAVSGIIGFVGLVVPHLVRLLISPDHRILIPASALLGALLLTVADTFARVILIPSEIPVGIVMSAIGGPFFLWLLFWQYRSKLSQASLL